MYVVEVEVEVEVCFYDSSVETSLDNYCLMSL